MSFAVRCAKNSRNTQWGTRLLFHFQSRRLDARSDTARRGISCDLRIGPLTNVGELIDKDPQTFRQLKRVVMMGGSLGQGMERYVARHIHPPALLSRRHLIWSANLNSSLVLKRLTHAALPLSRGHGGKRAHVAYLPPLPFGRGDFFRLLAARLADDSAIHFPSSAAVSPSRNRSGVR